MIKKSGITVLGRRLACENSKFFVYFDHVTDPAGNEVKDYLVVAPKYAGPNMVTGVAILPIVNEQVGLISIYRPALRDFSLEIPHGFVDEGEEEKSSALRELLEETGVVAEPQCIRSLGFITPDSGILAARVQLFVAEGGRLTTRQDGELGLGEFQFFDFPEFERMIERSEVQDTFTLAAWCKYRLLKQPGKQQP